VIARAATPGPWADYSVPLSGNRAAALLRRGFKGVGRYAPLPGNSPALDISGAELRMATGAGLEVTFVQHPRAHNALSAHAGASDAMAAIAHLKAVLVPAGCHCFLDLEGVVESTADQVAKYCNDWADAVVQLGYRAGLYVGFNAVLSPAELYALHNVTSYWSDAGPRSVAVRGFALKQRAEVKDDPELGDYDPGVMQPDALDDVPVICTRWYP
jgi:hypothetical protein